MGLESTIPVFERAKIFRALDRAATVIGVSKDFIYLLRIGVGFLAVIKTFLLSVMPRPALRHSSSYTMGQNGRDVKLTTRLHLLRGQE
jgi:hypothetical protein